MEPVRGLAGDLLIQYLFHAQNRNLMLHFPKKIFFVWLLLLPGWYGLQAQDLDRKIDISFRQLTLEEALYQLMDDEGVPLLFRNDLIPGKTINNTLRQYSLARVLNFLLEGTGLRYRREGEVILIEPLPQSEVVVSGRITSQERGERIIGAAVYLPELNKGTYTNEYGQFSLALPPGTWTLQYSHIAYTPVTERIQITQDTLLIQSLAYSLTLEELVVWDSARREAPLPGDWDLDLIDLTASQQLPRLAGESDLIRTIHLLPGIQTGADGIGGLFIRGGSAGHNLVMVDGVPVYNINHAAGLFSVFNSSVLKTAKLHKGAYPARYEGRLSSVLDIRTREGNYRRLSGEGELGLLAGKVLLEGPTIRGDDRSSFLVAGRWSMLNPWLEPRLRAYKEEQGEVGSSRYNFYDLNLKANYALSPRSKIFLSYYRGSDNFDNFGNKQNNFALLDPQTNLPLPFSINQAYNERVNWGNQIMALRWNTELHPKLFGNATLTYSELGLEFGFDSRDSLIFQGNNDLLSSTIDAGWYSSSIQDLALKLDFDWHPALNHYLRFGMKAGRVRFQPGVLRHDATSSQLANGEFQLNRLVRTNELAWYAENTQHLGQKWRFNYGAHLATFFVDGKSYWRLQPRMSVYWQASRGLSFNASVRKTDQFLHLLTNSAIGLPTDLWVPSTGEIVPESALQYALGGRLALNATWTFSAEAYFKKMDHLLTYAEGVTFIDDWEKNVTQGEGSASGIDLQLTKGSGRTTGWISYSYAFADRRFPLINQGNPFPFKYDRRHDLKVSVLHHLTDKLSLSASFLFGTGLALSLPNQQFVIRDPAGNFPPVNVIDYGSRNQYRLPDYHRLDLGAQYRFSKWGLKHELNAGVTNLYDRRNPLYLRLSTALAIENNQFTEYREFVGVNLLPILPSINYSVKF